MALRNSHRDTTCQADRQTKLGLSVLIQPVPRSGPGHWLVFASQELRLSQSSFMALSCRSLSAIIWLYWVFWNPHRVE